MTSYLPHERRLVTVLSRYDIYNNEKKLMKLFSSNEKLIKSVC